MNRHLRRQGDVDAKGCCLSDLLRSRLGHRSLAKTRCSLRNVQAHLGSERRAYGALDAWDGLWERSEQNEVFGRSEALSDVRDAADDTGAQIGVCAKDRSLYVGILDDGPAKVFGFKWQMNDVSAWGK